jgi:hypothetical protein
MIWVLRDRNTNFYVAHDLLDGYCFTSQKRNAVRFPTIASARSTVLQICDNEKKLGRKPCLKIERVR